MIRPIFRSMAATAFLVATAMPTMAQIPLPPLPSLEIRVSHSAPPRLRREHRLVRPGRDYVWINGSWDWQGDQWVWIDGRWARPEQRGRWIAARYIRDGGYYRYEPAHWSYQRVVESDDYRRWRSEHHRGRGRDRDRDRDHDNRDHDRNRN